MNALSSHSMPAPSHSENRAKAARSSPLSKLKALGVRYPVMQAGMTEASGPTLAGAVSTAGGIGTLGLLDLSVWEEAIARTKARARGRPFAVNLLLPYTRARHVDAVIRQEVPIVTLFWGSGKRMIRRLRSHGIFVFQQVGSKPEAQRALDVGVDGLIIQGREAGGHVRAMKKLVDLLPEVAELTTDVPVFAAGGIYSGADARGVLDMGAQGVCTGTRFLLTPEADIHHAYRERLLAADRTVLTRLFGLGWPDLHRVVPNAATDRWCDEDGAVPLWLLTLNASVSFTRRLLPMKSGLVTRQRPGLPAFTPALLGKHLPETQLESAAIYAGEHVGRLRDIRPAADIVAELAAAMAVHCNDSAQRT